MPPLSYEIEDVAAISEIVHGRASRIAIQKFFQRHEEHFTNQAKHCLNAIPKDLHEQARNHEQAKQYAAMAKAFSIAWTELEMASK